MQPRSRLHKIATLCLLPAALCLLVARWSNAQEPLTTVPAYGVAELSFEGPPQRPSDSPARDVTLSVVFRHESGSPQFKVQGFWDGDGRGGNSGGTFLVRFCPTVPGKWVLQQVESSAAQLQGQHQGQFVIATPSQLPGFWKIDEQSPGHRWYRRSSGAHSYIVGNTHYAFLSGYGPGGMPTGNDIAQDIAANAKYFKKLRFSLFGDHYPNPTVKPFLDDQGHPTDDGDFSHRPNPAWFHARADTAVRTAFDQDLIADLIIAGPDMEQSRATLRARHNGGDATPWLRYIAARYGSYPNVWVCLSNEYNIRTPKWTEKQVAGFGATLRSLLPYPTPLSVHACPPIVWSDAFDTLPPWNDHQIVQKKMKTIAQAADTQQLAWGAKLTTPRNKPTINDELSYQGAGDKHTAEDTIEAHLGAFLGGGYGSTGYKPGNKLGQYFIGRFNPEEHTAAVNLGFMREVIDRNITFWKMAPDLSAFDHLDAGFRGLAWPEHEYVLGTDAGRTGITANLPAGTWRVTQYDLILRTATVLDRAANGTYQFDSPESRAVMFHFKRNEP